MVGLKLMTFSIIGLLFLVTLSSSKPTKGMSVNKTIENVSVVVEKLQLSNSIENVAKKTLPDVTNGDAKKDKISSTKNFFELKKSIAAQLERPQKAISKERERYNDHVANANERTADEKQRTLQPERIFGLSNDVHLGDVTMTWETLLCFLFPGNCEDVVDEQCPGNDYTCSDGSCIPPNWECDDYNDCGDFSDEVHCSIECPGGQVKCKQQPRCIPDNWLCDDYNDCDDGSDEEYCSVSSWSSYSSDGNQESEVECSTSEVGRWTEWGAWSECNAGCGSGVSNRTRDCECPGTCSGDTHEYTICPDPDGCRPEAESGCGARNPSESQTRIVGGENAARGAWPWQALLYFEGYFTCGGSLYQDQYIITAAHCVHGSFNALDWRVYLGKQRLSTNTQGNQFESGVSQIIIHPAYNPSTFDSDIAILRLSTPVQPSPNADSLINNICIAEQHMEFTDAMCFITGWGTTSESGFTSSRLQEALVPYIGGGADCYDNYSGYSSSDLTENMFCAGYQEGGVDACQGDSGGPLVCKYPDPDGSVDRWYLVGVTSWGYGCARRGTPGIYTKVQNYNDWITQQIHETAP